MDELLQKVKEMRRLQRLYFSTRSADVLKNAKAAEHDVDECIKRIEEAGKPRQLDLFGEHK